MLSITTCFWKWFLHTSPMEYFQHSFKHFPMSIIRSYLKILLLLFYDIIIHSQIMLDSNKQITRPLTSITLTLSSNNKQIC